MKLLKIFLFVFLASSSNLAAQGFDQNGVNTVIQEIASGTGPITKAEYEKFWSQIGITNRADKEKVITMMRKNFLMTQEYQQEIWKCAEEAWMKQKIPNCEKAKSKFEIMRAEMKKLNQEKMLKPIEDVSTNLLQAASKHEVVKNSSGGAPMPLTLEMIQATRKNMESMLKRFEQVLRVTY